MGEDETVQEVHPGRLGGPDLEVLGLVHRPERRAGQAAEPEPPEPVELGVLELLEELLDEVEDDPDVELPDEDPAEAEVLVLRESLR
ncbi:hypothetical protein GCM10009710_19720 [Aeromicrobium alkaliterrae]|uniref:Uncharacterized protein n=1 Tax=Aeromicrobium alkaliterrae TaxID=302168 RepID=A0ABP4VVS8_9ACTN